MGVMGERIPLVNSVEYLTDWKKLESMLATARGREVSEKNAPKESPQPMRTSPTLEELGKVVNLEKLKEMFDERERRSQSAENQPPAASQSPPQITREENMVSAKKESYASPSSVPAPRQQSRRNADMMRWSLNAVAFSAAEFLAGAKSPSAGLVVLGGAVTAAAALMKKYDQPASSESLVSAVRSVAGITGANDDPAVFRSALERVSPQAKALFSEMDRVSSDSPKSFSPKDPSSVQNMASALEAHGIEEAVTSYHAIYRGTAPPLRRPSSGLKAERGMRREGGDRVRVMGGF